MWFIGQFENGSYGFQQEGCPPRYTSRHEAECIKAMYEELGTTALALRVMLDEGSFKAGHKGFIRRRIKAMMKALAKANGGK